MIEINLLPSGEKRRSPRRAGGGRKVPALPAYSGDPYMAGLGVFALLVFLGLGFLYWRKDTERAEMQVRLDKEVADSTTLTGTIDLVQKLSARQDTIEKKIEVIRSVDERRYVWPHIMDEVSRAIPPYTWLTKLAATEDDAPADTSSAKRPGPAFNLEGSTGSTQALTRFMKSLEASPFIAGVTLVTSEQTVTAGRSYQKFTLEARWEMPDSSFIETVPMIAID